MEEVATSSGWKAPWESICRVGWRNYGERVYTRSEKYVKLDEEFRDGEDNEYITSTNITKSLL